MSTEKQVEEEYRDPILLHVSEFKCRNKGGCDEVKNCLRIMANHQINNFPGVITFMFSAPDPDDHPFTLEFIEIYQHEKDFWAHSNDKDIHQAYFKGFAPKNKKESTMYSYGALSSNVKSACDNLGSNYPGSYGNSYILNEKFSKRKSVDTDEACLLRIKIFPQNDDESTRIRKLFVIMLKENIPITFHIAKIEDEYYDLIILYENNKDLENHFKILDQYWSQVLETNPVIDAYVYGNVNDKTKVKIGKRFTITYIHPEIGYVLHPNAEICSKKKE